MRRDGTFRLIGVTVLFLFIFLLLPVRPAQGRDPGMIRGPETESNHKKKKKFPLLLVLGGTAAVVVLAALVLQKKEKKHETYDIRGDWTLELRNDNFTITLYMVFQGTPTYGIFSDFDGDTGTYKINGNAVSFQYDSWENGPVFSGTFTDHQHMEGTYSMDENNETWQGRRGFGPTPATSKKESKKIEKKSA